MGKYGKTAKLAVRKIHENPSTLSPQEAWINAANEIFQTRCAKEKGCPKNAFLGLCESGKVTGVPSGSYNRSTKNKNYALVALSLLQGNATYNADQKLLWEKVIGDEDKVHNQQMDVVISLFEANLLTS